MHEPRQTKPASTGDRGSARDFISVAVHDLREPLRAIRASSDVLAAMSEDWADQKAVRCVRLVQDGTDRIESLVHDIAEYCYAEIRELEAREVDMDAALAEARTQLAESLKKNEALLTQDSLPAVTGDFDALADVFRILIGNACKFRGGAAPHIHVGAAREESERRFFVRDNGAGFDPAYADLIFRPFERLNGRQYPGSGLGLPLAKRIIERHAGRIWAESAAGQGSVFWFSLPA